MTILGGLSLLLFVLVWVRTAWVCDDAYITFRCVDNAVHGHGLVFNVGERVQAYTHPLWMLLHLPFQALVGDPYWSTLAISLLMSLTSLVILARGIHSPMAWIAIPLVGIASKAFVEYASSGLENPLTVLLLLAFAAMWARKVHSPKRIRNLALMASLMLLNRMDTVLLIGPALAVAFWQERSWVAFRSLVVGLIPFIGWEIFSIIYYGFPFPNTAYAKLGTGIATSKLLAMGFAYFKDSLHRDPVTLPTILAGLIAAMLRRRHWPLALGIAFYMVYICRIGGDFMSGRFFVAPFVMAVLLIGKWAMNQKYALGLWAALATIVGFLGPTPMLWDPNHVSQSVPLVNADGIADERAFYYEGTGLANALSGKGMPDFRWVETGKKAKEEAGRVRVFNAIGFIGYYAGPEKYIIDPLALSDPLLARLPALYNSGVRVGHYPRMLPVGYFESQRDGNNVIQDSAANALFAQLKVITRGPILSIARWKLIWQFNNGSANVGSLDQFRIPTDTVYTLPQNEITFEDNEGAKFSLPVSNRDSLGFVVGKGPWSCLVWMKAGKPLYSSVLSANATYAFAIPAEADTVALVPEEHWPLLHLQNLRTW
jgi:arabinofuranosyltransferase